MYCCNIFRRHCYCYLAIYYFYWCRKEWAKRPPILSTQLMVNLYDVCVRGHKRYHFKWYASSAAQKNHKFLVFVPFEYHFFLKCTCVLISCFVYLTYCLVDFLLNVHAYFNFLFLFISYIVWLTFLLNGIYLNIYMHVKYMLKIWFFIMVANIKILWLFLM